jgi:CubicO group peptidase (beta-lactamase class C family)/dipeptidyl aminopeptidase/acylaminoacyl peptidase
MSFRHFLGCTVALSLLAPVPIALGQETKKEDKSPSTAAASASDKLSGLDAFIEGAMKDWKVPGLAIAVIEDGKVVHMKGYGFRDVDKQLPVTPQTLFAIGSISKSFTVTGLGMLADEGKLDWDAPLRRYLPDFQLYDRVATEQATPRDLVTHRTGLPRHDFVWYANSSLGRRDLYARLKYLEPSKEFRSTWQYQNLMFMTAGILAEQISGKSWEDFTRERIMEPLGMTGSNFSVTASQKSDDFALPYNKAKDDVKLIPFHDIDAVGPAGSINSSVDAMIKYVQFHIARGKPGDRQLLSQAQADQMQSPQMVIPSPGRDEELGDMSYGMGLMIGSYRGTKSVEHGGGIDGFISLLSFLPRKKVGVIVLTNLSGPNPVPMVVTRNVFDRMMGLEPVNWAGRVKATTIQSATAQALTGKNATSGRKDGTSPSHALADYAGRYQHPAYGVLNVEHDGSALKVSATSDLSIGLHHFHYDIFESEDDPSGRFDKRKITFLYDKKGDIDRISISLEPAVSEIVFTRMPDDSMKQKSTLESLAGDYQLGAVTVTVALKGDDALTLTVPGQPTYDLTPTQKYTFDLKGLAGYSVVFNKDVSGTISELVFFQPNGNFVAKRKGLPAVAAAPSQTANGVAPASKQAAANGKPPESGKLTAWTPELMMNVRRIPIVRPSPGGERVAYVVTSAVMNPEKSEYVSQIYVANADGKNPFQLTFGDKSSTNPQWSPDGQFLAFTSDRAGHGNLYVLRVAGGEAEQLTNLKSDITALAWSPDGQSIAYTMATPKGDDEEKNDKGKNDARWVDEDPKMSRIYVVPVQKDSSGKREPRPLSAADVFVGSTARFGVRDFDWSPDSKTIVFAHRRSPKADDWTTTDVSLVDVATAKVTPLAKTAASEFSPYFSPDGQSIAMVVSDDPPTWAGSYSIQVVPAAGGTVRKLPVTYDQQPGLIGWSANGRGLYFIENRGTVSRVSSVEIESGEIVELNRGNEVIPAIEVNRTGTHFGFASQSPQQPLEAYVSSADRFLPVRVSQVHADLPELPLGKVEVVRWKSFDGQEIEGILTYPVNYESGKRVPLLLQVHGGPSGVFLQGYQATPMLYPNATFAARGYAILQPNPRGSSGYGRAFRYANYKDWGGGDFKDIMAGVDHVISMGVADPDRLGVMGWSYGGYMTSWIVTQTQRFKAASVGAGVTNLVSFTGTADIPGFLPDYLGTQPWDNVDLYRARSALFNARTVKTPTLVQHGEADARVPISQGYEFYNALKQQGVPTRMLVLPRQPHGPTEPKMMLRVMESNLEWFEKYLGSKPTQPAAGSAQPENAAANRKESGDPDDAFIQAEMKKRNIPGLALAVVRNGEVTRSKGFGLANVELNVPVTTNTVFQLQSITKTFTATAILMLVEQGKIGLDDRITERLENLPESWKAVTVRQLLSHTSGIKDFINEPTVNLRLDATPAEIVKSLADKPLNFEPGEQYRYSNTGYQLLGMAIEKITGRAWGDFLRERIFEPLEMKDTRVIALSDVIPNRASGYTNVRGKLLNGDFVAASILAYPGGGVRSTVLDLAKWDAALYSDRLVSKATLDQMWTPATLNDGSKAPYGLGWFLGESDGHRYVQHTGSHMTGFGTIVARYPDDRVTFIVLTNQNGANPTQITRGLASRYFGTASSTAGTP